MRRRLVLALLCAAAAVSQQPSESEQLLSAMEVTAGMTVAEMGAGDGAMTVAVAKRLGETSRVFSSEVEESKRKQIAAAAKKAGLSNVEVVEAKALETNFPDACCDAVYMRRVYHHFSDAAKMSESILRSVKPGGRVVIVEFERGHGIKKELLREKMIAAGFEELRSYDKWRGNDYCIVFRRPGT